LKIEGGADLIPAARWKVEGQRGRFVRLVAHDDEVIE